MERTWKGPISLGSTQGTAQAGGEPREWVCVVFPSIKPAMGWPFLSCSSLALHQLVMVTGTSGVRFGAVRAILCFSSLSCQVEELSALGQTLKSQRRGW